MTDFNITARDQLTNPGKIFEEITKFTPGNLKTSRSGRSVSPFNFTTFNLSEILMRIPAFDSPENAMSLYEGIIAGTMGSFWDPDSMGGFGRLLPPDLVDMLEIANPDGERVSDGGSGGGSFDGGGGAGSLIGRYSREGITPSTKAVPSGVKPVTRFGSQVVREVLGFNGTIGGMRQGPGTSDHITGHAIDVMVGYGNAKQKEIGDMIADFFYHNRVALRVKYVIWYDRIASSRQNWAWRYYDARKALGRTDITARHKDHPHISFNEGPAPNNPRLEWPDGYVVGSGSGGGGSVVFQ